MIVKSAEFVKSAANPSHYPPPGLPEIAFAGRSNVGKSSLINTLVNRKRLVKTSSTPGRTQLINFFDINAAFTFVDLPGYGYAKVPEKVKKTWGPMIERYLTSRSTLKGVVVILDLRREPSQADLELVEWLAFHHLPVVFVLTKADKIKRSQRIARHRRIAETVGLEPERFILFSAKTRQGKDVVWEAIAGLMTAETAVDVNSV